MALIKLYEHDKRAPRRAQGYYLDGAPADLWAIQEGRGSLGRPRQGYTKPKEFTFWMRPDYDTEERNWSFSVLELSLVNLEGHDVVRLASWTEPRTTDLAHRRSRRRTTWAQVPRKIRETVEDWCSGDDWRNRVSIPYAEHLISYDYREAQSSA